MPRDRSRRQRPAPALAANPHRDRSAGVPNLPRLRAWALLERRPEPAQRASMPTFKKPAPQQKSLNGTKRTKFGPLPIHEQTLRHASGFHSTPLFIRAVPVHQREFSVPYSAPRIFLSYSRTDRDFAIALRDELTASGHAVWHDIKDMGAGQWWDQIAEQLRVGGAVEHIVLVVSPQALASRIVEREWRLARREGKMLSAVVPPAHNGRIDFATLPRWMSAEHHYNYSEPDQRLRLISDLRKPGKQPRRPDPLKPPPDPCDHVRREDRLAEIKTALLDTRREAKATTVVLSGAGGFGKSTLAVDIVNDAEIQDACYDGILWAQLSEVLVKLASGRNGQEALRAAIKERIETLIRDLTGAREVLDDLDRAKKRLAELLAHKRVLLVIDDTWDRSHAEHFIEAAPTAAKLVTSRRRDILGDTLVDSEILSDREALDLISLQLQLAPSAVVLPLLTALAKQRAGKWPLLLRLINRQLRLATTSRPGRPAQTLSKAVADLIARFDREGLDGLDEKSRERAVRLSVGVSFEMLLEEDRERKYPDGFHEARYRDLASFQEAEVPIATIARLWAHLGVLKAKSAPFDGRVAAKRGMQERSWRDAAVAESAAVLERLYTFALLQAINSTDGTVRLHDVMRTYLSEVQSDTRAAFHRQFVLAYDAESVEAAPDLDDRERTYFYTWYPTHLAEAREREALDALLLDPGWMKRKLSNINSPLSLVSDYERHGRGQMQGLIGHTLRLTTAILARDPAQLFPQLFGRLLSCADRDAPAFLQQIRQLITPPALLPVHGSLTPPGSEVVRIEAHQSPVTGLFLREDKRLVSASVDGSIRAWDTNLGAEVQTLYSGPVGFLKMLNLPNGQIALAGADNKIHLFDNGDLETINDAGGHEDTITEMMYLHDGSLITGSHDGKVLLWDIAAKRVQATWEANGFVVKGLALLDSDTIVVGAGAHNVSLLNLDSFEETGSMNVVSGPINQIIVAPERRIILACDGGLEIWDSIDSDNIKRLDELSHLDVHSALPLSNSRLAVGFYNEIQVLDTSRDKVISRFAGDFGQPNAIVQVSDFQIASASDDGTIRIWTLDGSPNTHHAIECDSEISTLTGLPNNELAIGLENGQVQIWNTGSHKAFLVRQFSDCAHPVTGIAIVDETSLAAASGSEIYIWKMGSGEFELYIHHEDAITSIVSLRPGVIASCSDDCTIVVANFHADVTVDRLTLESPVRSMIALSSNRIAAIVDERVVVYEIGTNGFNLVHQIDSSESEFTAIAADSGGRLVTGSYHGVQVWDAQAERELISFERYGVLDVAVLKDDRVIAATDDELHIFNLGHDHVIDDLTGMTHALAVLADGRIAFAASDREVKVMLVGHLANTLIDDATALPSGHIALAVSGRIELVDPSTTKAANRVLCKQWQSVQALTICGNRILVAGCRAGTLVMWDALTFESIGEYDLGIGEISVVSAASEDILIVGSREGSVCLFCLMKRVVLKQFSGAPQRVYSVGALMERDVLLVAGSEHLRLLSIETGDELHKSEGNGVQSMLRVSGDLFALCIEENILLAELTGSAESFMLEGHTARICALALCSSNYLVSGGYDRTVRIWGLREKCEVARLEFDAAIEHIVVSQDRRILAIDSLGQLHWLEILIKNRPSGAS